MDRLLDMTSRAEAHHFWFRGFRGFVRPLLERAANGRSDLAVLDCGCGTGYNLRMLGSYGRVAGMDLNAAGLQRARETGRPIVRADATRIPYRSSAFDLVTTFDMLQCVPDDAGAVREMARVMKPGGHFVATVAALPMLHGDHSVLSEEVRRYTRDAVHTLLRGAGLTPLRVAYAFGTIFPLVFGVRTAQRLWRGHSIAGTSEIRVPPAPVNAALTALVVSEAAIAPYVAWPFGSSLVVLARKIPD